MPIPFVVPPRPWGPLPGVMAAVGGEPGVLIPLDAPPGQQGAPCPSCGQPLAAPARPLAFAGRWDGYEPLDGPVPPPPPGPRP